MALLSERFYQFTKNILLLLLLNVQLSVETSAWSQYEYDSNPARGNYDVDLQLLTHRIRREVTQPPAESATSPGIAPAPVPSPNATTNKTATSNLTTPNNSIHESTTLSSITTTQTTHLQIPNVGVNGTGIHRDVNQPKVSDPIISDDDTSNGEILKQLPNIVNPADLENMTLVNHTFYNSSFIGQPDFFQELWANISKMKFEIHPTLSSSHRRAATVTLSFDFPFYGHPLKNVTVATGGFIYTGEHVHNWLAATQYIAPLMANFDTRENNDSVVKTADDGTNFTVVWENVALQECKQNKTFTFAVILRKDGDIFFVYKDVPIPVQYIEDKDHPVKVGISDAYLQDRVILYKRRKTIFEYHRVNFMDHNITSGTVLRLYNLPTCLLYTTCQDCMNHKTSFNCSWCSAVGRCSSGIDRNKQEWLQSNCDKNQITKEADCPLPVNSTVTKTGESTSYGVSNNPYHNVIMRHDYAPPVQSKVVPDNSNKEAALVSTASSTHHSSLSGVVIAFATVVLIAAVASWIFYAYKNPHTRSGQLLIKYRPSTWSWKRGEARYTAATIHM